MPIFPDPVEAPPLRVAIVHEWLSTYAGSERVVEQMLEVYPQADVFSVVDFLEDGERGFLKGKKPITSFIQHLPFARRRFRHYLPLMPLAMEQLDVSGYDIVVSSNHAVAKGVITGPNQLHVCYVHSPIRYAWDLQGQYLKEAGLTGGFKSGVIRLGLHYLRQWDVRSANGVDVFLANSRFIARRINKVWRREAQVIYPPVDVQRFEMRAAKEDFFLTASRMVPYKKVPLIVEAFARRPDKRLVVIGDGTEFDKAKALATPNVTLLGYQSNAVLVDHMQRAKAFVFAAEEDFGITPVEAQACGTPVIAFGRGGSLETVRGVGDSQLRTGAFFDAQTADDIVDALDRFDALPRGQYRPQVCRANAERFAPEFFRNAFSEVVARSYREFQSSERRNRRSTDQLRRAADVSVG